MAGLALARATWVERRDLGRGFNKGGPFYDVPWMAVCVKAGGE